MSDKVTFYRQWAKGAFCGAALLCAVSFASLAQAADNIRPIPSETPCNAYPTSVNGFHVVDFKT